MHGRCSNARCEKAVTNDTLLCVEGKSRDVGLCDSESEACRVAYVSQVFVTTVIE